MKYSDETIMKLIKCGFKSELIANELEVPLDYVYTLKQRMRQQGLLSDSKIKKDQNEPEVFLDKDKKENINTIEKVESKNQTQAINNISGTDGHIKQDKKTSRNIYINKRKNVTSNEELKIKLQKLMFRYRTMYDGSTKEGNSNPTIKKTRVKFNL